MHTNRRSPNTPSNDDFKLLNIKLRPDHHKLFKLKCTRENTRMSDYLRDHVAQLIAESC